MFDELTSVKSFKNSEESSKFVTLISFLVEIFNFSEHFDEVTHDNWEDSDTKKHAEGHEDTFGVAPRVEITESYSRKCGERKIIKLKDFISFVEIVEAIACFEVSISTTTFCECRVAHYILLYFQHNLKKHTKEKTNTSYLHKESKCLQSKPHI